MTATGELLGMGIGTLLGYGLAFLVNCAYKYFTGKSIPSPYLMGITTVICSAGGLLACAHGIAKNHEREELSLPR
jgi:hypothetical protein